MTQSHKHFKKGDLIMRQGDNGDCAYIIETGRVEILIRTPNNDDHCVGTRGAGTIIGEMALVDKAPRTATIRAIEDCSLLEITTQDFSARLDTADPILRMIIQVILMRYRDTLKHSTIMRGPISSSAEAAELSYTQNSDAVESIKIANAFKDALDNGNISLHYQPMISLDDKKIVGFEALMRWEDPEKGAISPGVFIPIIEDSGIIIEASKWALKESLQALKRIEGQTGYENNLFMSVNFSSKDFAADGFVDTVYETISTTDTDPKNLHLEITERLLMGQPESAKQTLEMCHKAGMAISIDDFGTGYSSLSYLHYFPIDTLKIDQSFVRGMLDDDNMMQLVKSIIALSKNLKLNIIAEGIEEKAQAQKLHELGCNTGQGYYFAKPMGEADVIDFIQNANDFDF